MEILPEVSLALSLNRRKFFPPCLRLQIDHLLIQSERKKHLHTIDTFTGFVAAAVSSQRYQHQDNVIIVCFGAGPGLQEEVPRWTYHLEVIVIIVIKIINLSIMTS